MSLYKKDLQKNASLTGLLMGPIGHFATNLAGRAAHHGSNLGEVMAHKGFQHGAGGASISWGALRSIKAIAGPEATATYEAARQLGEHLYNLPPEQRQLAIRALSTGAATDNPKIRHFQNSPVIGDLLRAAKHDEEGTAPTPWADGILAKGYSSLIQAMSKPTTSQFDTPVRAAVQHAAGLAPVAAFAGVDALATGGAAPIGAAAHFGVNTARELISRSSYGRDFMRNTVTRGLEGAPYTPKQQAMWDVVVSPAALDGYRMGRTARRAGVAKDVKEVLDGASWRASLLPNSIRDSAERKLNARAQMQAQSQFGAGAVTPHISIPRTPEVLSPSQYKIKDVVDTPPAYRMPLDAPSQAPSVSPRVTVINASRNPDPTQVQRATRVPPPRVIAPRI